MSASFPCRFEEPAGPRYGLVVLRTDETLEGDMRRLLPPDARVHVARLPNAADITPDTLGAMEGEIARAAALLPEGGYDAVVYGCTSASAVIGSGRVAALLGEGCRAERFADPLSALVSACRGRGVRRLAFVSPYVESVSARLVAALEREGIAVVRLVSFGVGDDREVARIDTASVVAAAREAVSGEGERAEAVFLSCTNLRTLDAIAALADIGRPVWSSNLLLAHALRATAA